MNTFVLIIFFHVGILGTGNSNSVTSVANFKTKEACEAAGQATKKTVSGTVKEVSYVCVQQ